MAHLDGVNLRSALLLNARMEGASLVRVDLRDANMSFAQLQEADLQGARLENAILDFADLRQSRNVTEEQLVSVRSRRGARLPAALARLEIPADAELPEQQ